MNQYRSCNLCGEEKNIRVLYLRNGYAILKCRVCGLVYVDIIPTSEDLKKIYSKDFFARGVKYEGGNNNPSQMNAHARLEKILNLPDLQMDHWIDVGCATGEFVYEASKHAAEAVGIEYSEFAAKQAAEKYNISVINVDFIQNTLERNYYDLITAWDFIEHVSDPFASLKNMYDLLKPKGYLVFSTGDIDTVSAKITGKYWHLMTPPRHLYFFSKKTITNYLKKTGFSDVRVTYPSKKVPLDFMIWKFFSQINENLGSRFLSVFNRLNLGRVVISINLGDIMEIYARKP